MNSKIIIVDCGSSKTQDIVRCIEELNEQVLVIKQEDILNKIPEAKGIIIGGNPDLIENADIQQIKSDFSFINTYDKPILGICYGHQVIGLVNDAKVSRGTEQRTIEYIEIINSSSLFNGIQGEIIMGEDHCEEIELPKGFKLIASSPSCEVEAMQHKFKPIFGVQFHPEISGMPGLMLLRNFVKACN